MSCDRNSFRSLGRTLGSWTSLFAALLLFAVPLLHQRQLSNLSTETVHRTNLTSPAGAQTATVRPDATEHDEHDCPICQAVSHAKNLTPAAAALAFTAAASSTPGAMNAGLADVSDLRHQPASPRAPPSSAS